MSTAAFSTSATFAPTSAVAKASVPKESIVVMPSTVAVPTPVMHADDAAALRVVSAIIFAVVAAGTLLMLGTVLLCG